MNKRDTRRFDCVCEWAIVQAQGFLADHWPIVVATSNSLTDSSSSFVIFLSQHKWFVALHFQAFLSVGESHAKFQNSLVGFDWTRSCKWIQLTKTPTLKRIQSPAKQPADATNMNWSLRRPPKSKATWIILHAKSTSSSRRRMWLWHSLLEVDHARTSAIPLHNTRILPMTKHKQIQQPQTKHKFSGEKCCNSNHANLGASLPLCTTRRVSSWSCCKRLASG